MTIAAPPRPRAVSVLEVDRPAAWSELEAVVPLAEHVDAELSPTRRAMKPSFEGQLDRLAQAGLPVLIRYARRAAGPADDPPEELLERLERLPVRVRALLHRAQRHHRDLVVIGSHTWDPVHEADLVDALHGAGLIEALPGADPPRQGRYRLHPDLPPPPEPAYDLLEAVMPPTDDLAPASPGLLGLLHDVGALSAALAHHPPRRTLTGGLQKADARRLGSWLGSRELADHGDLDRAPRWARALVALESLGGVSMDPVDRTLRAEPRLERLLEGTAAEAMDRLLHRMVDRDLQAALPAIRAALRQAGDQAVDELILVELLEQQHRDVLFAPWLRDGVPTYPALDGLPTLPWTTAAFAVVEGRMLGELLRVLAKLGVIRRAPGVFAATVEGRVWATGEDPPAPPVWVNSDLEVVVPPHGLTPWERYQVERLGRCVARDVVDRYRLERGGLEAWLATHELQDAIDLLRRRSPGLPDTVLDALRTWAASATRFVLTRGVVLV